MLLIETLLGEHAPPVVPTVIFVSSLVLFDQKPGEVRATSQAVALRNLAQQIHFQDVCELGGSILNDVRISWRTLAGSVRK